MPEEVKETSPSPEAAEASQQKTEPAAAQDAAAESSQPSEEASVRNERRLAAALTVLLAVLCIVELGLFTYIGLNIYRNVQTNRMIAERNAAITQEQAGAGQAKIQYSGLGRRVVDGVVVSESGASGGRAGTVSYVLDTSNRVFHTSSCSEVASISPEDYDTSIDGREAVVARGYTACTYCNP